MNKLTLAAIAIISSSSVMAGPRVEDIVPTINDSHKRSIESFIRAAATSDYDSYSYRFKTGTRFGHIYYKPYGSGREKGGGKIVISTDPGSSNPAHGLAGCGTGERIVSSNTMLHWTTNPDQYPAGSRCALRPNTYYYFNVMPKENCISKGTCMFKITGQILP